MSVQKDETVVEKRDRLGVYCSQFVSHCELCPIATGEWGGHTLSRTKCLDFKGATVEEMDKALAIFEGLDTDVGTTEPDPVNHPSHYTSGGIECLDALKASMTPIEYAGFLKGQVFKYLWRYRLKGNPVQDLEKARFYLDRLIAETEEATE